MPTRPRIEVSLVTPDDYEAVEDAFVRAFQHTEILTSIYPPSIQPSIETRVALRVQSHIKGALFPSSDLLSIKATLDGRVIGSADWHSPVDRTSTGGDPLPDEVKITEISEARTKAEGRAPWEDELDATKDLVFQAKFLEELPRVRKKRYAGKPHWYLASLFVHPSYQGVGVGKALLAYGTDQADAAGVPTWLESSAHGRHVYSKQGFEVIDWCAIAGDEFEGGWLRWPGMERQPVPCS